jgi:hypothetical protein
MCFVFIWEQTATSATYKINWSVFITRRKVFTAQYGLGLYIKRSAFRLNLHAAELITIYAAAIRQKHLPPWTNHMKMSTIAGYILPSIIDTINLQSDHSANLYAICRTWKFPCQIVWLHYLAWPSDSDKIHKHSQNISVTLAKLSMDQFNFHVLSPDF